MFYLLEFEYKDDRLCLWLITCCAISDLAVAHFLWNGLYCFKARFKSLTLNNLQQIIIMMSPINNFHIYAHDKIYIYINTFQCNSRFLQSLTFVLNRWHSYHTLPA